MAAATGLLAFTLMSQTQKPAGVLKGLPGGQIEIDGDPFHNPMPAQESVLSDQQIADVLTFIRNNFGNKASAVTAGEVKVMRGK